MCQACLAGRCIAAAAACGLDPSSSSLTRRICASAEQRCSALVWLPGSVKESLPCLLRAANAWHGAPAHPTPSSARDIIKPRPTLPPRCAGKYTIFGQVIDGMEVLDRMEKVGGCCSLC